MKPGFEKPLKEAGGPHMSVFLYVLEVPVAIEPR